MGSGWRWPSRAAGCAGRSRRAWRWHSTSSAWCLRSTPSTVPRPGPSPARGWTEPSYARAFIRRSALLRGRPVADIRALIEELYQTTFPMDFDAVLASPVEFHPLATDAATGQSTDLRPLCGTPAELRLALRA